MDDDPVARAARILAGLGYLSLATADADGAWVAPVHHRLLRGGGLYFESAVDSRHSRAIVAEPRVGGAVFDSTVAAADADGVQFEGVAEVVPAEAGAVRAVLARRIRPLDDLEQGTAAVLAVPQKRLHAVELRRVFVFDRDAWRRGGTDARIEVPLAEVVAVIEAPAR